MTKSDYKAINQIDDIKINLTPETAKDKIKINGGGYIETHGLKKDRFAYYESWDKAVKSFKLRAKKYNCIIIKY